MWRFRGLIVCAILAIFLGVSIRTVRVEGKLRQVETYSDEQGLHHVYFTNPGNDRETVFLGEEIFKGGVKVLDTYRENDSSRMD